MKSSKFRPPVGGRAEFDLPTSSSPPQTVGLWPLRCSGPPVWLTRFLAIVQLYLAVSLQQVNEEQGGQGLLFVSVLISVGLKSNSVLKP